MFGVGEDMKIDELVKLIKETSATRKFDKTHVDAHCLKKITEAGQWSLSIHTVQPWSIIVVRNKKTIEDIALACSKASSVLYHGFRQILASTSETIRNSRTIIVVLNKQPFSMRAKRFGRKYQNVVKNAEVQCIAAFVQNMNLAISSLDLKSVWLTSCIFAENEIKRILAANGELIAILCVGFSKENVKRSKRNKVNDFVSYIL